MDRLIEVSAERGRGQRVVPATLNIFLTHFPRFPVLPGVLLVHDLVELATQVLEARDSRRWTLAEAHRIRFRDFVRTGDIVDLVVDVVEVGPGAAICSARALVGHRTVCSAQRLRMVADS